MNYCKNSVLTLTLSLLSTLSVFAQCGTISFGSIQAEDEGGYSVEVLLSGVSSLSSLNARISFPFGLTVIYDDALSEANSPNTITLTPQSGSYFRVDLGGSVSSISDDLLAKIYFSIPFGDCVNSLTFSNVSFFIPGGGCSSGLVIQEDMTTAFCPPSRSVFGSLEGVIDATGGHVEDAEIEIDYFHNFPEIAISDVTGYFSETVPTTGLTITPNHEITGTTTCGITTLDIIKTRKHIQLTAPFTETAQFVAADMNGSNTITTFDLTRMQRVVLGYPYFDNAHRNWEFIPSTHYFGMTLPSGSNVPVEEVDYPTSIIAPASSSNYYGANFAAIKIGDVTGDCALNGGRGGEEEGSYALEEIFLADHSFAANETALVPVYASTDIDLSFFGYTLNFDEDAIEVTNVFSGQLVDFTDAYRIVPREENRVSFVWFPYDENAQSIDADEPLFFLELKALSAVTTLDGIVSIEDNGNLGEGRNGLHRTSLRISNATEPPVLEPISHLTVTPNPFADRYTTSLFVTETQTCIIELYNMQGQRVHRQTLELVKGENILTSDDLNNLPAGTYVQKVILNDQTLTNTLIKQR
jgi:hypothetical protein